jgi:hypothetical protein
MGGRALSNKPDPEKVIWNAVQGMDKPFTAFTVMSQLSEGKLCRNISHMQVSKQLGFLTRIGKLEIVHNKVAKTYMKKED